MAFQRDLELLYKLYRNRALSTAQMQQVRGVSDWYIYEKIDYLRKQGLISSGHISGNYIPNQRKQGAYHKITGKGVGLLRENDYLVDYQADELRVSKYRLPYLLIANDLSLSLEKSGWEYQDSREVKKIYQLNRGDTLQGVLTNPDNTKSYALYIFLSTVQENTLARIKHEIIRNPFEDILIVTRGADSFNMVVESFRNTKDKLIKGGSIKILPFGFAKGYLGISNDNKKLHESFLHQLGITLLSDLSNKNAFESNVKFDYAVEYNGQKMYFVDMLDNDLMKLQEVRRYRKEEYTRIGKRVLVLTSTIKAHYEFHRQMLGDIAHVDYLTLDAGQVLTFASGISNKNVLE